MTQPIPSTPRDFPDMNGPSSPSFDVYSFATPPEDHVPSGFVNLTRAFTFSAYLTFPDHERVYMGDVYLGP
jgi:hypothetical protein